jgi:hypothetical protein
MSSEILLISCICIGMVMLGLLLGFILIKVEGT